MHIDLFTCIYINACSHVPCIIYKHIITDMTFQRFFNRSIINVIWAMVMGKRYSYDDAKLATLLKTFIAPGDINFLSPLHFIPGALKFAPYLPFLKKDVQPFIKVTNFIKVKCDLVH